METSKLFDEDSDTVDTVDMIMITPVRQRMSSLEVRDQKPWLGWQPGLGCQPRLGC